MSDDWNNDFWNGYMCGSSEHDTGSHGRGCSLSLFKIVAIAAVVFLVLGVLVGAEVTWPVVKFLFYVVLFAGWVTLMCK